MLRYERKRTKREYHYQHNEIKDIFELIMTHKSKEKQNIKILKLKILMLLPLSFRSPGGYLIFTITHLFVTNRNTGSHTPQIF